MGKYRKKPVEIEAWQWFGGAEDATRIIDTVLKNGGTARYHEEHEEERYISNRFVTETVTVPEGISIDTLEGVMMASAGDYIIKGVVGEFYPCKPDVFLKTYEAVDN